MNAPRIVSISPIKLVGMSINTIYSPEKISGLFREFMPRRNEITTVESNWVYSMHMYPRGVIPDIFSKTQIFEKWVGVEVKDSSSIPEGMKYHEMSGGLYAVFLHKGTVTTFDATLRFIYKDWMPGSGYQLDEREHFEILTENYLGPMNPDSEEEVFIPIRKID